MSCDPQHPRRKDLISAIEAIAAKHGDIAPVDEDYYRDFLNLSVDEWRRLVIQILLSHEKEVVRLSEQKHDPAACVRVADFVTKVFTPIGMGLMRCDPFGRLHFTSRIGPDSDSLGLSVEIDRFVERMKPETLAAVRDFLPWQIRHLERQGELPM